MQQGEGGPMTIESEIRQRLVESFAPTRLEVVNESHRHAGIGRGADRLRSHAADGEVVGAEDG